MVDYIKYNCLTANNWSRAWSETIKERPWAIKRLEDSSTISQLQSKLWIATELGKLNKKPEDAMKFFTCVLEKIGNVTPVMNTMESRKRRINVK